MVSFWNGCFKDTVTEVNFIEAGNTHVHRMENKKKQSRVRRFRKILLEISNRLEKEDVKNMMMLVVGDDGFPGHAKIEEAKSGIDFFMLLLKHDKISADDYSELTELLSDVNRQDLVKKLRDLMKPLDDGK